MDLTETIKVAISVIAIITIPPLALATTIIPAIKELIPSYTTREKPGNWKNKQCGPLNGAMTETPKHAYNSHKNYATGTHK